MYEYLTEEEIEEILEKYGSIENFIGNEVEKNKSKTTRFMDKAKYLFFAYLILKKSKSDFNDRIDKEYETFYKQIIKDNDKGYKIVSDLMKYQNEGKYINLGTKPVESELNRLLGVLKLDMTSTKTENDKYMRYIKNYYDKTKKTADKEYIDTKSYLSKKVSQFDKVEKTVVYRSANGDIRAYFDIASYDSMVYNTNLTSKGWQETIKNAKRTDSDLVYVEPHPFSCPLCQEWQGKIYSLTGANPMYPRIEEALRGGLKHPNCKHAITSYYGQQETSKYTGEQWTDKYDARQKINALELKKSRLKNDNKIYKQLDDQESIDKNNQKIRKLNEQIKEQKVITGTR